MAVEPEDAVDNSLWYDCGVCVRVRLFNWRGNFRRSGSGDAVSQFVCCRCGEVICRTMQTEKERGPDAIDLDNQERAERRERRERRNRRQRRNKQ